MASTLLPTPASAANHEWRPKARILASGEVVFDTVTVIGTSINWGAGSWDSVFNEVPVTTATNGWSLAIAIAQAKTAAINLANACKNPALSSHAKSTTSQNDVVDRWLAANEMMAQVILKNAWSMYQAAYGSTGITVIVNTQKYHGFKVTYADGASETWIVTPNYATSSMKLFDQPAPDSLTAPDASKACNGG